MVSCTKVVRYDPDDIGNRDPARIEAFTRVVERVVAPYHRAEVAGLERIPAGAALYVGNHSGGFYTADSFLFGAAVHRARGLTDVPYALAHQTVMGNRALNALLAPLGVLRACHANAERVLASGRKVLVYPGGDVDSMRPFRHRHRVVFDGRRGFARLAIRIGVPIVPVVSSGSHETFLVVDDLQWLARAIGADRRLRMKVWPLVICLPWGICLGPLIPYVPWPARIRVAVLRPIHFDRHGPAAAADDAYVASCAERVRRRMEDALGRMARREEPELTAPPRQPVAVSRPSGPPPP